jgi:hypothetical protein
MNDSAEVDITNSSVIQVCAVDLFTSRLNVSIGHKTPYNVSET